MATYNIFLGSGVRSVGDVTLMRRGGKQVARLRLRTIKNPRTEAQATQRNFVAPVMRFYGALRSVLKGSYQGLNTDASYNVFQRINIALARTNGWYLQKGAGFFPMPYQLSRGSISPMPYTWYNHSQGGGIKLSFATAGGAINTIGNLSTWFTLNGYKQGDVVTVIAVLMDDDGGYYPVSYQFYVNTSSSVTATSVFGTDIVVLGIMSDLLIVSNQRTMVAGAVIVSRYQGRGWLRSTQSLCVSPVEVARLTSEEWREAAIASYMAGGSEGGGGVYPGGDTQLFNVAARDGRALLFVGEKYDAQLGTAGGGQFVQVKPDNLDDYYYIIGESNLTLCPGPNGIDDPTTWEFQDVTPSDLTISNSILCTAGSQIALWLQSIGVSIA